nr:hypothetical protein [Gloeobacter morelensis]
MLRSPITQAKIPETALSTAVQTQSLFFSPHISLQLIELSNDRYFLNFRGIWQSGCGLFDPVNDSSMMNARGTFNGTEAEAAQVHGQAVALDFVWITLGSIVFRKLLVTIFTKVALLTVDVAVFAQLVRVAV